MNRDIYMIWPLACASQFGNKAIFLGTYELQEDAARAYDKVARILGHSDLNFPNSDAVEIHGPRSVGADKAVAAAVEAARTFVEAGGNNQDSIYIGVSKDKGNSRNPWKSQIGVSSKMRGTSNHAHIHSYTHTHARTHAD